MDIIISFVINLLEENPNFHRNFRKKHFDCYNPTEVLEDLATLLLEISADCNTLLKFSPVIVDIIQFTLHSKESNILEFDEIILLGDVVSCIPHTRGVVANAVRKLNLKLPDIFNHTSKFHTSCFDVSTAELLSKLLAAYRVLVQYDCVPSATSLNWCHFIDSISREAVPDSVRYQMVMFLCEVFVIPVPMQSLLLKHAFSCTDPGGFGVRGVRGLSQATSRLMSCVIPPIDAPSSSSIVVPNRIPNQILNHNPNPNTDPLSYDSSAQAMDTDENVADTVFGNVRLFSRFDRFSHTGTLNKTEQCMHVGVNVVRIGSATLPIYGQDPVDTASLNSRIERLLGAPTTR